MGLLERFLVEDDSINQDMKPWDIFLIKNGLKCRHKSDANEPLEEYFEADELQGLRAFEQFGPMTPIDVFTRIMEKTPLTKGFIYKYWNIVIKDKKGFIIKPRPNESNKVIEKYNHSVAEERYKTTQSLEMINMVDFLKYIEEDNYERTD